MLFGKKKTIVLSVDGMHCGHCAAKVEKALAAVGCKASVDLDGAKVTVTAPEKLADSAIAEAVTKAGFPAKVS